MQAKGERSTGHIIQISHYALGKLGAISISVSLECGSKRSGIWEMFTSFLPGIESKLLSVSNEISSHQWMVVITTATGYAWEDPF
ncbi:hypothetical protein AVEN_50619-1 [Araneus ventricosus]|uniref:Uncharacterized protein n=1 Tax=Araneus ventricosus TaxID=182803 RepID=A0A4Y2AQ42_ARAVE|nr:hypothetical protein AVEN_50619-1 [Araneus ventricosus]